MDGVFRRQLTAVVLLERRLLPIGGLRQCRPQLGLQLLDGAVGLRGATSRTPGL